MDTKTTTDSLIELIRAGVLPSGAIQSLLDSPETPPVVRLYISDLRGTVPPEGLEDAWANSDSEQDEQTAKDLAESFFVWDAEEIELAWTIPCVAPIAMAVMADAFARVEIREHRVSEVYFNPIDYADVRKWYGPTPYDGKRTLWGARLIRSTEIPEGYVFVCGEGFLYEDVADPKADPEKVSLVVITR